MKFDHDVERFRVGDAGDRAQRWYGRCIRERKRPGMEFDRRGDGCELVQLLGLEHRRRFPHGVDREREHSHHPRRHAKQKIIMFSIQPVRTKPGDIRSNGRPHPAVPPRFLPGR